MGYLILIFAYIARINTTHDSETSIIKLDTEVSNVFVVSKTLYPIVHNNALVAEIRV